MISFLKPEEQHQHKNGLGWVANTATVEETAYIGPDALVYGNAGVYGDALVCGNAGVYGNARIYGNAQVSGYAQVYGDVLVYGDAWVYGGAWETSPLYIQGTKHAITNCAFGKIAIGCEVHSFSKWKRDYKSIEKKSGYTPEQIKEYGLHIAHVIKMGK